MQCVIVSFMIQLKDSPCKEEFEILPLRHNVVPTSPSFVAVLKVEADWQLRGGTDFPHRASSTWSSPNFMCTMLRWSTKPKNSSLSAKWKQFWMVAIKTKSAGEYLPSLISCFANEWSCKHYYPSSSLSNDNIADISSWKWLVMSKSCCLHHFSKFVMRDWHW